jgi:hypothetical protein
MAPGIGGLLAVIEKIKKLFWWQGLFWSNIDD